MPLSHHTTVSYSVISLVSIFKSVIFESFFCYIQWISLWLCYLFMLFCHINVEVFFQEEGPSGILFCPSMFQTFYVNFALLIMDRLF